jgi:hypothetical protein
MIFNFLPQSDLLGGEYKHLLGNYRVGRGGTSRLKKKFSELLLRFFNFTLEQLLYTNEFQESFWSCGEPPRTMKSEDQL